MFLPFISIFSVNELSKSRCASEHLSWSVLEVQGRTHSRYVAARWCHLLRWTRSLRSHPSLCRSCCRGRNGATGQRQQVGAGPLVRDLVHDCWISSVSLVLALSSFLVWRKDRKHDDVQAVISSIIPSSKPRNVFLPLCNLSHTHLTCEEPTAHKTCTGPLSFPPAFLSASLNHEACH